MPKRNCQLFTARAYRMATGSLIVSAQFLLTKFENQGNELQGLRASDAKPPDRKSGSYSATRQCQSMKETQLRRENQSPLIKNFPYNTFHVLFSPRLLSCFNEHCLIMGNEVIAPYFMTQEAVVIETSSSIVGTFPYLVDTSFAIS